MESAAGIEQTDLFPCCQFNRTLRYDKDITDGTGKSTSQEQMIAASHEQSHQEPLAMNMADLQREYAVSRQHRFGGNHLLPLSGFGNLYFQQVLRLPVPDCNDQNQCAASGILDKKRLCATISEIPEICPISGESEQKTSNSHRILALMTEISKIMPKIQDR